MGTTRVALFNHHGQLLWADHYRVPPEECLGAHAWHFVQESDKNAVITAMGSAMMSGVTQAAEVKADINGKEIIFRCVYAKAPADVAIITTYREIDARIELLTERERVVLTMLCTSSPKHIARDLGLSISTVQTYIYRAGEKLGLRGPALIKWSIANLC